MNSTWIVYAEAMELLTRIYIGPVVLRDDIVVIPAVTDDVEQDRLVVALVRPAGIVVVHALSLNRSTPRDTPPSPVSWNGPHAMTAYDRGDVTLLL